MLGDIWPPKRYDFYTPILRWKWQEYMTLRQALSCADKTELLQGVGGSVFTLDFSFVVFQFFSRFIEVISGHQMFVRLGVLRPFCQIEKKNEVFQTSLLTSAGRWREAVWRGRKLQFPLGHHILCGFCLTLWKITGNEFWICFTPKGKDWKQETVLSPLAQILCSASKRGRNFLVEDHNSFTQKPPVNFHCLTSCFSLNFCFFSCDGQCLNVSTSQRRICPQTLVVVIYVVRLIQPFRATHLVADCSVTHMGNCFKMLDSFGAIKNWTTADADQDFCMGVW